MKVGFSGGKEFEASLKELGKRSTMRRTADRALRKAAEVIRDRAKELAPDDPATGAGKFLRESIKIGKAGTTTNRKANSGTEVVTFVGIDGSVKPPQPNKTDNKRRRSGGGSSGGAVAAYSQFLEYGTSSMRAQPFMRPAFEEKREEAVARLGDDLRTEILKTAQRAARKAAKARA